jgi:hypothetical protein
LRSFSSIWMTLCALAICLFVWTSAGAQEAASVADPAVFSRHFWSQIRPDYSYLNGCVTGYRAFTFRADGYFTFNQHVHGSWRVDQQGNLVLRSKTGQQIILVYDKSGVLAPVVPTNATSSLPVNSAAGDFNFRRTDLFKECDE